MKIGSCLMNMMLFLFLMSKIVYGVEFIGQDPRKVAGSVKADKLILENEVFKCIWNTEDGQLRPVEFKDKMADVSLAGDDFECFEIVVGDGRVIKSSEMTIVGQAQLDDLVGNKKARRLAERFDGKQFTVDLVSSDGSLGVKWRVMMRDGSNYVRQEIVLKALKEKVMTKAIIMPDITAGQVTGGGLIDGSPAIVGNMFFAYEHPMAKKWLFNDKSRAGFQCILTRETVLEKNKKLKQTSVMGVVPDGQLRRGFLYYLERERTQPYRQFLNYNSWFDLSWTDHRPTEAEYLDVIENFNRELTEKRDVRLASFAWDEGWDDPSTIWSIDKHLLPDGFRNLSKAAKKHDAGLGVFMSVYGYTGYDLTARVKSGVKLGFTQDEYWLTLQDEKYYDEVFEACKTLIDEGVNYFKLDLAIAGMLVDRQLGADARYVTEVDPQLQMIRELRQVNPDIFVDMTIGCWASPFWLLECDTAWRRGWDCGSCGKGTKRQQWITYRDNEVYKNVVTLSPLYPLNSLQLHGVIFAQRGDAAAMGFDVDDLTDEIRTFFGCGTNVTSLFMTHSKMEPRGWDVLAEAAKWYFSNADVLVDTHWVGGDPSKGDIYGWASWSPRKGILVLRNPDDKTNTIGIDIDNVFELPDNAPQKYTMKSPWEEDKDRESVMLSAKKDYVFALKPFEVMVLESVD